ncbi:hypothetical protein [Rhizobium indicum]|uniref:Uncharacterized protein n=3 Tax=Rhizobium TaxID=379 RepID=A0ABX6PA98_9HYPH|nr:hypothetical protein [Rhizobium indicum]QKK15253.1 hypothetical protein FFM53_002115 [Rhizobium indicum]QKK28985.1 hypothetical protein FE844_005090 [Rhizobium indicum]
MRTLQFSSVYRLGGASEMRQAPVDVFCHRLYTAPQQAGWGICGFLAARVTFLKSLTARAKEYLLAWAFEFLFLQSLVDQGHIPATSKWIDDAFQD